MVAVCEKGAKFCFVRARLSGASFGGAGDGVSGGRQGEDGVCARRCAGSLFVVDERMR